MHPENTKYKLFRVGRFQAYRWYKPWTTEIELIALKKLYRQLPYNWVLGRSLWLTRLISCPLSSALVPCNCS